MYIKSRISVLDEKLVMNFCLVEFRMEAYDERRQKVKMENLSFTANL